MKVSRKGLEIWEVNWPGAPRSVNIYLLLEIAVTLQAHDRKMKYIGDIG